MTVPTFSINGAAEILERDRRTVTKSLRHVPPDAKVRGAARWKLKTIIDALERMLPAAPSPVGQIDPRLASLYAQFDAAEAAMRKLPTLEKRRAAALDTLRPIIEETQRMLRIVGEANGQDPEFTTLLADKIFMLALRGWEEPCSWTQSQCWDAMHADDVDA